MMKTVWASILLCLTISPASLKGAPQNKNDELLRDIFTELIEIDTSQNGNTTVAAEAMAVRLRKAGFPDTDIHVLGARHDRGNLVARFRGTGELPPMVLLAHLDVVEARPEDWSFEPYKLTELDGYFYGRGTIDDKAMAAIWISNFIRLKAEGWRPVRDVIVALTADEEVGGPFNGAKWLIDKHRDLVDAEFCINEGGYGQIKNGTYIANSLQAAEKVYQSYRLEVTNPGGHSSRPVRNNAIYHLAEGLTRLAEFTFPVELTEVTKSYFTRMAEIESGATSADMKIVSMSTPPDKDAADRLSNSTLNNALLRTTCVATQLEGGHAENALPQIARATVNCRLIPGKSEIEVQATLTRVLANDQITITPIAEAEPSPPSPLMPKVMGPIEALTEEFWPGVPVLPFMSSGATDGLYFRNAGIPTYGVSGLFSDVDDFRAHGANERIGIKQLYESREFLYRLMKELAKN